MTLQQILSKTNHEAFLPFGTKYETLKKRHTSNHTGHFTVLCKHTHLKHQHLSKRPTSHAVIAKIQFEGCGA